MALRQTATLWWEPRCCSRPPGPGLTLHASLWANRAPLIGAESIPSQRSLGVDQVPASSRSILHHASGKAFVLGFRRGDRSISDLTDHLHTCVGPACQFTVLCFHPCLLRNLPKTNEDAIIPFHR